MCSSDLVADLVERFSRDRKVFNSPDYKEEQPRAEFLTPLFESRGWDVYSRAGQSETFKQVIHKESIEPALSLPKGRGRNQVHLPHRRPPPCWHLIR